jgi:hypothetical protein
VDTVSQEKHEIILTRKLYHSKGKKNKKKNQFSEWKTQLSACSHTGKDLWPFFPKRLSTDNF